MTTTTTPAATADAIIRLLCERGTSDYIGESINQLEHCLQCAHSAAKAGEYKSHLSLSLSQLSSPLSPYIPFDFLAPPTPSFGWVLANEQTI